MYKSLFFGLSILFFFLSNLYPQSNIQIDNPDLLALMKGNYPADSFARSGQLTIDERLEYLVGQMQADSIQHHLRRITEFGNRNSANESARRDYGIRACREWLLSRCDAYNGHDHPLITGRMSFDYDFCGRHSMHEGFAVIPGQGERRNEIVIVVAHLDSRCEDNCDTTCLAEGADDNGSGSAALLELARVLPAFPNDRTIVILWTSGEEQGLVGARAFASFCKQNGIVVHAVFNNDIIGGVECGYTSSPPSCPGPGRTDSLNLRVFSSGSNNSKYKGLARTAKLIVNKKLRAFEADIPEIQIMSFEDRSGRGGDHIPFRQMAYAAVRFTSSFEHGDGNPSQPGYMDRQHSSRDVFGLDTDNDGLIDSFHVHFRYLRKNCLINTMNIINATNGPNAPRDFSFKQEGSKIKYEIVPGPGIKQWMIGLRRIANNEFDTIITSDITSGSIDVFRPGLYYMSVVSVDSNCLISPFGTEKSLRLTTKTGDPALNVGYRLYQNFPNPFDESCSIFIEVEEGLPDGEAFLRFHNMRGVLIQEFPLHLKMGLNEFQYAYKFHHYLPGEYIYSLWIDGKIIDKKRLVMQ